MSYNENNNEANGEWHRDGESHNRSWNCGTRAPLTTRTGIRPGSKPLRSSCPGDPGCRASATRSAAHSTATNTVYCQTMPLAWMDWSLAEKNCDPLTFTRKAIALRTKHPVLRRRRFFNPAFRSGGEPDTRHRVADPGRAGDDHRRLAQRLANPSRCSSTVTGSVKPTHAGNKITDDSFFICFNAHHDTIDFHLPSSRYGLNWEWVLTICACHRRHVGGGCAGNRRRFAAGLFWSCGRRPDGLRSPVPPTDPVDSRFRIRRGDRVLPHIAGSGFPTFICPPIGTALMLRIDARLRLRRRRRSRRSWWSRRADLATRRRNSIRPRHHHRHRAQSHRVADAMANPWFADLLAKARRRSSPTSSTSIFRRQRCRRQDRVAGARCRRRSVRFHASIPDGTVLRYFDHAFPVAEGTGDGNTFAGA